MSNIDKPALRIPERKKHNWGQAVMRDCDFCQQWALTVRHSDGGCICASCCDSEYTTALSSALVVALDELEAKDSTIATQQQEIRTLLNALVQSSEKRNSDLPDQKRIIGWRASDYTDETSDPELAKNWAAAIGVLPIFEGDVNTKLSAAAADKGE
ncbi:hypothetical protein POV99_07520 [Enterobacter kobei]|uniref:hypothetical protein n=1 Tax=Enterobacter kobei TaxID=208224 RepID=UPI002FFA9727